MIVGNFQTVKNILKTKRQHKNKEKKDGTENKLGLKQRKRSKCHSHQRLGKSHTFRILEHTSRVKAI